MITKFKSSVLQYHLNETSKTIHNIDTNYIIGFRLLLTIIINGKTSLQLATIMRL